MRRFLSPLCFALGSIWAAAGAMKLLFGVRLTLWLLPPFGLERVAAVPSLVTAVVLFTLGALLARLRLALDDPSGAPRQLDALSDAPMEPVTLRRREPARGDSTKH